MSNKPQLNSNENDVKSLKHSENNFLSPIKEKFHRKSTSNKGDIIKVNMNNNNNNFNKTNSKKKIEFSNVDFKLDSSKNKDLVKTAQNLTNFLKTKTLVNNQINDFIRRNSNISISNSSLATILENSNPAYAIANIALTSPQTVKRQKSKKKKNNNLNINSPKNKNARKSFTFLDLIKQENHQNLRNSMILAQPNFINNNIDKIKHKLKKSSNENILYKNTISSNSMSNKKLSSTKNINLKKNLYSSFILPSNNITKNLIKQLNQNSDNYFQSYENDLISSNINNILKKKRHSIVNYNNSNKLYEDFNINSSENEIFGSKKNSFNDKSERISNKFERKKLKRLTNYKNKNNLNNNNPINIPNIKSTFSNNLEKKDSEKSNESDKFKSLKNLSSFSKLQKAESKVYKNEEKKDNNDKNNDNNEIDENENLEYLKHIHELKYRNLSIKNKLVYDSLSDEESEDDLDEVFYINPRSNYKLLFDMMIFLCNLYFTFTFPLISSFYPKYQRKYFSWYTLLNYIVDIFYILDLILGFLTFLPFYNKDNKNILLYKLDILNFHLYFHI